MGANSTWSQLLVHHRGTETQRKTLEKENARLAVASAFFMWGAEGAESTETFAIMSAFSPPTSVSEYESFKWPQRDRPQRRPRQYLRALRLLRLLCARLCGRRRRITI